MMNKKIKYTKKFVLGSALVLALTMTGCGQSRPTVQEQSREVTAEVESNYKTMMAIKQQEMAEQTGNLATLLSFDDKDTNEWVTATASTLNSMESVAREIIEMEAPQEYRVPHALMVESAEATIEFKRLFMKGYDENDADLINRANEMLRLSIEKTEEATDFFRN